MFLLAYDTSGREGGVALARGHDEDGSCDILDEAAISGGTFSAQLIPETARLLEKHKLNAAQLGGFAVATGPGSFTGLRIGLAAVMGLAEALERPIAAVSVLEAMAWNRTGGLLIAALDASRKEVYVGEYRNHGRSLVREMLLPLDHLGARAEAEPQAMLVACDGEILRDVPAARKVGRPSAADYARIGWDKFKRRETVPVEELDANYIRRSDAEIFAKR